ncbi:MAG: hypothetical protein RLY31_2474 [Bacteroidota bacterium]
MIWAQPGKVQKRRPKMRRIRKVGVLGAGVMGSGIACHLANAGFEVRLLDLASEGNTHRARSQPAERALTAALSAKPSPLYRKAFAARIQTGNFPDDLAEVAAASDWVIEVVAEQLDIKQQLLREVDRHRRPGALVSTNTSGIPIHRIAGGMSEDFRRHFCGTHFFNPPRYMRLLEIIPTEDTLPAVIQFFLRFGDTHLGKQTVLAKDTPAFIANRIGVYAMARIYQLTTELGLTITEADALTGTVIGRPKTGTFRLGDLVGHDIAANVIRGIRRHCPEDEQAAAFEIPPYMDFLLQQGYLGDKRGKGFYERTGRRDEKGKPVMLALNLDTLTYEQQAAPALPGLSAARQADRLDQRIRLLFDSPDSGGQLVRRSLAGLFAYVSQRIPSVANQPHQIDDALRAGFSWELGPFEYWDTIGVAEGMAAAAQCGEQVAPWVREMLDKGFETFYATEAGNRYCYDPALGKRVMVQEAGEFILLDRYREQAPVFRQPDVMLHDIGEGVLCLEFRSKANTMGEGVLRGINDAIDLASEGDWRGLVIGNNARNFSVGANLMMVAMMAYEQDWDQLSHAVRYFQDTVMRCRYSPVPVVAATQGYVFGGACELLMHCDAAVCAAESYIGLVEAGVGLIPGGAGTKEFALRTSDAFFEGDVQMPTLMGRFRTLATATVASSAAEAYDHGYLRPGQDRVVLNAQRIIKAARDKVVELSGHYVMPIQRKDITVLGRGGLATLYLAANELRMGGYASEHDIRIANKMAWVLCGGDLSGSQQVSERYLLDLEREAFLSLCGEPKTLERIQHMLTTNKPLRN